MQTIELTARQHELLDFIVSYLSQHDAQPTYREMGAALGIGNVNGVVCHINSLVEKGYLKRRAKNVSRSLSIDWDKYQTVTAKKKKKR